MYFIYFTVEFIESKSNTDHNYAIDVSDKVVNEVIPINIQENSSIISTQSAKPILITPSKAVACAHPLLEWTPSIRTYNYDPTKAQLKQKIKLLQ